MGKVVKAASATRTKRTKLTHVVVLKKPVGTAPSSCISLRNQGGSTWGANSKPKMLEPTTKKALSLVTTALASAYDGGWSRPLGLTGSELELNGTQVPT